MQPAGPSERTSSRQIRSWSALRSPILKLGPIGRCAFIPHRPMCSVDVRGCAWKPRKGGQEINRDECGRDKSRTFLLTIQVGSGALALHRRSLYELIVPNVVQLYPPPFALEGERLEKAS